ncbi:MAG TPA: AlpA family phage regulatory protein [Desulfuromonadales bacterium]|jgi:prophage regulatory protein|nr:AlpA family phage regulatory protein [Deltaproteobacteria bacterium]HIJ95536.1 AlpA family phage regulatory protein [Desulfuromonadales bacterium]
MHNSSLPETGFVRLPDIIGNAKADPPIKPVYPVSRSTWWEGVRSGRYPQPVKLGPRITAWRVEDIRALIERHSRG